MNKCNIGIFGVFQNGKSTLINCLLDDKISQTGGNALSVTVFNTIFTYGEENYATFQHLDKVFTYDEFLCLDLSKYDKNWGDAIVYNKKPFLKNVQLVDTPGFNANLNDSQKAEDIIGDIDFAIVLVLNKGTLKEEEKLIIKKLAIQDVPFMVVMNCMHSQGDDWNPMSQFNIKKKRDLETYVNELGSLHLKTKNDESVWIVNLAWYWYGINGYIKDSKDKQEDLSEEISYYSKKYCNQSCLDFVKMSGFGDVKSVICNRIDPWYLKMIGMAGFHSILHNYYNNLYNNL